MRMLSRLSEPVFSAFPLPVMSSRMFLKEDIAKRSQNEKPLKRCFGHKFCNDFLNGLLVSDLLALWELRESCFHIGERRRGEGIGVGNKFFEAGFSVSQSMFLG